MRCKYFLYIFAIMAVDTFAAVIQTVKTSSMMATDDEMKNVVKLIGSNSEISVEDNQEILSALVAIIRLPNTVELLEKLPAEWENFKSRFKKVYADVVEEKHRFVNFIHNLIFIERHNAQFYAGKLSYKVGLNHMSDYSKEEYLTLLGFKQSSSSSGNLRNGGLRYLAPMSNVTIPDEIDWRSLAVTPVKDQGNCGSCWAFSTTGSLEGQHYRKTKKLVNLSEQQLVDCNIINNGCSGGLMSIAFDYIRNNGGIDTEQSYPYVSGRTGKRNPTCNFTDVNVGSTDKGLVYIDAGNEFLLKVAVALVGPISVAIDANHPGFFQYKKGVFEDQACSSTDLDHGVLVVGYGIDKPSKIPYWLVKNSWSTKWGDNGYIKMRRNHGNMCGIATYALFPLL